MDSYRLPPSVRRFYLAVAEAIMPPGRRIHGAGQRCVDRFTEFLAASDPWVRGLFLGVARIVAGLVLLEARRPFVKIPREQQQQILAGWAQESGPRRHLVQILATPLKVAHFDDPAIHAALGSRYIPDPIAETSPPRYLSQVRHLPDSAADQELEAEVVVVGTGAGGAVVARELAGQGHAVVLLEEGRYFRRPDFARPHAEKLNLLYRSGGMLATFGNVPVILQMGRCVGGTTAINSGTCYRPPPEVLRAWREQLGLSMFTEEHLEPYLRRVEGVLQVAPASEKNLGKVVGIIRRGCDHLGYAHGPVPRNAPDCDAQAHCQFGCPTDAKRSTNVSYVPLALEAGAQLFTGARVTRILTKRGRAAGVRAVGVLPGGGRRRLTVRSPLVVISCGALLTPVLLMRNGLCLRGGQLGRNLSIHPAGAVFALFDEPVRGWEGIPQGYAITEFVREGIVLEGGFPRLEFATMMLPHLGRELVDLVERYDQVAAFGFMIQDESRGRVFPGPGSLPLIAYNLKSGDRKKIKKAWEILTQVFLAAGARRVILPIPGVPPIEGDLDLARFRQHDLPPSRIDLAAFHPLGTARLGTAPSNSVTRHDHETHAVPGLFIVDGSSVPTSLGVNPQLTIMALATRASEFIAEKIH